MNLQMIQDFKRLTQRVDQLEHNMKTSETTKGLDEMKAQIEKLQGEIRAMKARMGKNAKAE
jgi:hypothetical protein